MRDRNAQTTRWVDEWIISPNDDQVWQCIIDSNENITSGLLRSIALVRHFNHPLIGVTGQKRRSMILSVLISPIEQHRDKFIVIHSLNHRNISCWDLVLVFYSMDCWNRRCWVHYVEDHRWAPIDHWYSEMNFDGRFDNSTYRTNLLGKWTIDMIIIVR